MKKIIVCIMVLSLLVSLLGGCRADITEEMSLSQGIPSTAPTETESHPGDRYRVAVVTDCCSMREESMNIACIEAGRSWCEQYAVPFHHYKSPMYSYDSYTETVEQAITEGSNVLILVGGHFARAIVETAEKYPQVYYIAIDVTEYSLQLEAESLEKEDYVCPGNVFCALYRTDIAGFLAGYAAVKMGYRDLGVFGSDHLSIYTRELRDGFVQGADYAAGEQGIDDVYVKVAYAPATCFCDQPLKDIRNGLGKWKEEGTEVIFFAGGYVDIMENEPPLGIKVIDASADRHAYIEAIYGKGSVLTTAVYHFTATIHWALATLIFENRWEELGGKIEILGLVSGEDPEKNHVILSPHTQWNDGFTQEDYIHIVTRLLNGQITIQTGGEQVPPTEHILVEEQGLFKESVLPSSSEE